MKAKIIGNKSGHGFNIGEIVEVECFCDNFMYFVILDPSKWKIFIIYTDLEIIK